MNKVTSKPHNSSYISFHRVFVTNINTTQMRLGKFKRFQNKMRQSVHVKLNMKIILNTKIISSVSLVTIINTM
jgi:hypothetical protein